MRRVTLSQASRPLAEYAVELTDEIVVVTKGRRAVAALVPLANADRESLVLGTHPELMKLLRSARMEIRQGKVVSLSEMRTRVRGRTSLRRPRARR